jgi:hypothetical protein
MKNWFLFLLPRYQPANVRAQLERTRQQADYEIHRCQLELIAAREENASLVARIDARLAAAHAALDYAVAALANCNNSSTDEGKETS